MSDSAVFCDIHGRKKKDRKEGKQRKERKLKMVTIDVDFIFVVLCILETQN